MNERLVNLRLKNKLSSYGKLKSTEDINYIREAGRVIADIFSLLDNLSLENQSTLEIDHYIEESIHARRGRPSFKTIKNYNFASCISINNEVIHGIPSKAKIVKKGDIVKIDMGVVKRGYFADACKTYRVGEISTRAENLVNTAHRALMKAIEISHIGKRLGDLGAVIDSHAIMSGYSTVKKYSGHGVGFAVHEPPSVLHYGKAGTGLPLVEGMVIAIEPMINEGTDRVKLTEDGWTVVTEDGLLSAQFEHTIAITKNGPEILTI